MTNHDKRVVIGGGLVMCLDRKYNTDEYLNEEKHRLLTNAISNQNKHSNEYIAYLLEQGIIESSNNEGEYFLTDKGEEMTVYEIMSILKDVRKEYLWR